MATVVSGGGGLEGLGFIASLTDALMQNSREKYEREIGDKASQTVDKILGDFLTKKKGKYTEPEYETSGGDWIRKDPSYQPDQSNQPDLMQILKKVGNQPGMGIIKADTANPYDPSKDWMSALTGEDGRNYNETMTTESFDPETFAKDVYEQGMKEYDRLKEDARDKETKAIQAHYNDPNIDAKQNETAPIEKTMTKEGAYNNPLTGTDLESAEDELRMKIEAAKAGVSHKYQMPDTEKMVYDEKRYQKAASLSRPKPWANKEGLAFITDPVSGRAQPVYDNNGKHQTLREVDNMASMTRGAAGIKSPEEKALARRFALENPPVNPETGKKVKEGDVEQLIDKNDKHVLVKWVIDENGEWQQKKVAGK